MLGDVGVGQCRNWELALEDSEDNEGTERWCHMIEASDDGGMRQCKYWAIEAFID